jgi:hypothetical protein
MKIIPVGADFVPCGPRDMMKIIVAFRNFAKAPNLLPYNYQNIYK